MLSFVDLCIILPSNRRGELQYFISISIFSGRYLHLTNLVVITLSNKVSNWNSGM